MSMRALCSRRPPASTSRTAVQKAPTGSVPAWRAARSSSAAHSTSGASFRSALPAQGSDHRSVGCAHAPNSELRFEQLSAEAPAVLGEDGVARVERCPAVGDRAIEQGRHVDLERVEGHVAGERARLGRSARAAVVIEGDAQLAAPTEPAARAPAAALRGVRRHARRGHGLEPRLPHDGSPRRLNGRLDGRCMRRSGRVGCACGLDRGRLARPRALDLPRVLHEKVVVNPHDVRAEVGEGRQVDRDPRRDAHRRARDASARRVGADHRIAEAREVVLIVERRHARAQLGGLPPAADFLEAIEAAHQLRHRRLVELRLGRHRARALRELLGAAQRIRRQQRRVGPRRVRARPGDKRRLPRAAPGRQRAALVLAREEPRLRIGLVRAPAVQLERDRDREPHRLQPVGA
eukprot:7387856-Prymnesium_polylepis.1